MCNGARQSVGKKEREGKKRNRSIFRRSIKRVVSVKKAGTFAGPMDRLSKSQVGQLVEIDREFADWSKSAFLSRSESNL